MVRHEFSQEDNEPPDNAEQPEPAPKWRRLGGQILGWTAIFATATASAAGVWYAISNFELIGAHWKDDTAQERHISDTLSRTFGSQLTIRCVAPPPDQTTINPAAWSQYDSLGFISPVINIPQQSCNALEALERNPNAKPDNYTLTTLMSVAREFSRLENDEPLDEGAAQCLGIQRVLPLAEALGLAHDKAAEVQKRVAVGTSSEATPGPLNKDSVLHPECIPGGALDLRIPDVTFPHAG